MRRQMIPAAVAALVLLGACSDDDGGAAPPASDDADALTIAAAPDLVDVVEDLADTFDAQRAEQQPIIDVRASTQDEVAALAADPGAADADVAVAPALWLGAHDELPAQRVGRYRLVVAVAPGNPQGIAGIDAFAASSGVRTAFCGDDRLARTIVVGGLRGLGVDVGDGLPQQNCIAASTQLLAGQLDAVLLYRTDLPVGADVDVIDVPDERNVVFDVAVASFADDDPAASEFVEFLGTAEATFILTGAGLLP